MKQTITSVDIEKMVKDWEKDKSALDVIKKRELESRKAICDLLLNEGQEGVAKSLIIPPNAEDYISMEIVATGKLTRKVDIEKLREVWEMLPAEIQACFTMKPTLSVTKYKALHDTTSLLPVITESRATPTLKINYK